MNIAPASAALAERQFYTAIRVLPFNVCSKLVFQKDTGCWQWVGSTQPNGYGRVWTGTRLEYAHRHIYEALLFPIKPGHDLSPTCRNKACANPEHQAQLTRSETLRRGHAGEYIASRNRIKTHCPKGHAYDQANTLVCGGSRRCRACGRERWHLIKSQAQAAA